MLLCSLLIISANALAADVSQEALLKDVKAWVSSQLGVDPQLVDVPPLDARLRMPPCPESLRFDFPFTSRDTVRAQCASSKNQVFVRVSVIERTNALIAARDLRQGQIIAESDLGFGPPQRWTPELIADRARVVGKTLRQPLAAGEPFRDTYLEQRVQVIRIVRSVKADEAIPREALKIEQLGAELIPRGAAIARLPSSAARAGRELIPGQILLTDDVKEIKTAVITTKDISPGQRLQAEMFELGKVALAGDQADFLTDPDELENLELTRSLPRGAPLRRQDTRPAMIVYRGQQITVQFASTGGLEISFVAEALTDARLGDIISVKNQESGKIIQAIVSGKGAARAR